MMQNATLCITLTTPPHWNNTSYDKHNHILSQEYILFRQECMHTRMIMVLNIKYYTCMHALLSA